MPRTRKILILGGSSYVGRHLFRRMGPERTLATYNKSPFDGGIWFDSLSMRLDELIDAPTEISHAVVLLGDTQPDNCIAEPARSQALNVDSVKSIFDLLAALEIKPIFTSSEFVFDGNKGSYVESDEARPILLYGEQKLDAEHHLRNLGIPHTILRLAKVYGDTPGDGTLLTAWVESLRPGSALKCAADQAFSPVYVEDVVEAIMRTVERDLEGTYHVSGNRRFRRIELLEMVLAEHTRQGMALDIKVEPCSIHDFNLPERRPVDVSIEAGKLAADAGMQFVDIDAMCARIVERGAQISTG